MNQEPKLFQIRSEFAPQGDQPNAIAGICEAFARNKRQHVLMGVTGSGKTFTMAHVIQRMNIPTLIMAPNKTLAAQLFQEFKELFPDNAVEFFISYYDYYQPEAYIPNSDTYIAKDALINDDIDKMRHSATRSLFERKDVIIVASVSCIYGLGSPSSYASMVVTAATGQQISRDKFLRSLIDIQYTRNDAKLQRGSFRVRGDVVDVLPSHERDEAIRFEFFGDEIERIAMIDALTGATKRTVSELSLYPNSHYVTERTDMQQIISEILKDLGDRLREFKAQGKMLEFQRLEQRVMQDVEMMEQLGWCSGIENYSRYLTGLPPGHPPPTLLDYFPEESLIIIDESHITLPQLRGMFRGDRQRKQVLVDFGFRLPSALDNRPLNFEEFLAKNHRLLHVSATPSKYELEASGGEYSEQIIRPTGLVDPQIEVRPAKNQVDDLFALIRETTGRKFRVLITTLTKRMAEDLSAYYQQLGVKVRYLHADIDSLERAELLRDLRKGVFDVLIGINLLREGLDLPEVALVAVMDADKEGFLRSRASLIQIVGRAARNSEGRVIFYADRITDSMRQCMDETNRRRDIQMRYNAERGLTPQTVIKKMPMSLRALYGIVEPDEQVQIASPLGSAAVLEKYGAQSIRDAESILKKKNKSMERASANLEFERAAQLRDEVRELEQAILSLQSAASDDTLEPENG
jgi:excinuclease ABC subunit B